MAAERERSTMKTEVVNILGRLDGMEGRMGALEERMTVMQQSSESNFAKLFTLLGGKQ